VTSGARVTAVVDVDEVRAGKIASVIEGCTAYTDPSAAIAADGVDAALIAFPGPPRAALLTAFEYDLPVPCERPLTPGAASAVRGSGAGSSRRARRSRSGRA
jgi:myo-inositol 2-dehydrogenase / D-chiro-inositol 1-dehydrogenase